VRIAALYDIHGNAHALDAVLADVEGTGIDLILVGGDVASGPFPAEVVERLLNLPRPARFVMGNADRELIAASETEGGGTEPGSDPFGTLWCASQLSPDHIEFMRSFERVVELDVEGIGSTLFCHGSPRSDEELITPATPQERILPMLEGVGANVVVCGHTHMQFDREVGLIRLINAGSVGMPYEHSTGAYWATFGGTVELRRTPYDLAAAAEAIRASEWPQASEFAEENVLTIPGPEEAIAVFEGSAG
jgi:predicted phosphodiesterase